MNKARIVARDKELEARHHKAQEELCRHRWHWTLDESNDERVSIREYAKWVGRHQSAIRKYVNGYNNWLAGDDDVATLGEYIARAALSAEVEAATEAYAAAHNTTFTDAATHHRREVRAVADYARQEAVDTGQNVSDVIHSVAANVARGKQRRKERIERQKRDRHNYVTIKVMLNNAHAWVKRALEFTEGVEYDEDELEVLADSLNHLAVKVSELKLMVTGDSDIDWDAEFRDLDIT